MSNASPSNVFVELHQHALLAARVNGATVEFLRECPFENKAAIEETLAALQPDWKSSGLHAVLSLAPRPAHWHLSTADEASRHRSEESLARFAAGLPHGFTGPLALTACHAADGSPLTPKGANRWLLGATATESLTAAATAAAEWRIEGAATESATFANLGAVATALRLAGSGAVALWDIGVERSQIFLVTARGVEAVVPCAAGFDQIFSGAQTVIGLKFRAAAARLFFNDDYDFAEIGAAIATHLAPALQAARAALPAGSGTPALACLGITARQAWFVREAATVAGLQPWMPDPRAYATQLKLQFSAGAEAALSVSSFGLLHLIASSIHRSQAWHPTWASVSPGTMAAPEASVSRAPMPSPALAPVAAPSAPAARNTIPPVPIVLPAAKVAAVAPVAKPTPVAAPAPAPAPKAAPVAKPAPAAKSQPAAKPAAPAKPAAAMPIAAKAATAAATITKPVPPAPKPAPVAPPSAAKEAAPAKRTRGLYLGLAALLVIALVGVWKFYTDARETRLAAEKAATEATAAAQKAATLAETRAREIETKAKAEAARIHKEAEAARESAVALARQQAADQTRRQISAELEAERIAKSPGILIVTTSPSGADVSIDGGPVRKSPLALNDILPGTHKVRIALVGHDPIERTAEIKGTQTTDLGLIALERAFGTLHLASRPDEVNFSVKTMVNLAGTAPRSGRTPASFDDLAAGDYIVTFTRAGWKEQVQNITIAKGATVQASATFAGSVVQLTSTPTAAVVTQNGNVIGVTPLTLTGLAPQKVDYTLTLAEHDPIRLGGEAADGRLLALNAQMLRTDRIARPAEIKRAPNPVKQVAPDLTPGQRELTGSVSVSAVIGRDGKLRDLRVESTPDKELGRTCLAALSKWKFEPAIGHDDQPLNAQVSVPFVFSAEKR